jgi:hypothetical protein
MTSATFNWTQLTDKCLFVGEYEWCPRGEDPMPLTKPKPKTVITATSPERERLNRYHRERYARLKAEGLSPRAPRDHVPKLSEAAQREARKVRRHERYTNNREVEIAQATQRYHDKKNTEKCQINQP